MTRGLVEELQFWDDFVRMNTLVVCLIVLWAVAELVVKVLERKMTRSRVARAILSVVAVGRQDRSIVLSVEDPRIVK